MNNTQQKHIVVVLGMHRSGTSAITRSLQVMGVNLGGSLLSPNLDNEKGFWEDLDIIALNIDLLKALGHDWHTLTPILAEELAAPITDEFKLRAVEVLRNKLNATHCFGLKDPRIARLLPFWKSVFDHLQVRVSYIIACRNPMSVARSLAKRDGFNLEKGYYLWLEHMLSSLTQTENQTSIVVDYDRLMDDPAGQLQRIAQHLRLTFNPESPEFIEYRTQFLEDSLRHTRYRVEDLKLDRIVPPTVIALYIALVELAADTLRLDEIRLTSLLERISEQLRENYAALHYMQACDEKAFALAHQLCERDGQIANLKQIVAERDQQIANLNQIVAERDGQINNLTVERDAIVRSLVEIRRSSSWRITAPLRFVGHLIHGNYDHAGNVVRELSRRMMSRIPTWVKSFVSLNYGRLQSLMGVMPNSSANQAAITAIVNQRCAFTREALRVDPLSAPTPQAWTEIDISIVTYNSSRWITNFVDSLIMLDYPKILVTVRFVDNSSTDSTLEDLHAVKPKLRAAGFVVEIMRRPNHGYGAGHNAAISKGTSPFCLVTNVDITLESDALRRIVAVALADNERAAAWELRQKPYEHPKFYDPITGTTNWNSHACVLLRRSALEQVGGYDETLFMYGEDVELSYRLRCAGYLLRYCPQAVVWHYSYESANQVKPIQYVGSTFANLYLRLQYGNRIDALAVPMLGLRLLLAPEVYSGSRREVLRSLLKLSAITPRALLRRRRSDAYCPFRTWDYELSREGAFVEQKSLPLNPPLVSIITRTYRGRQLYLRQALLSVAHQTYPNIEHIVVEDGGETMRPVVDNISQITGRAIHFIKLDKLGRSAAGNAGLSAAKGRWCLFLDDDDLLFSDHVEVLANALLDQTDAAAAYSLAWEVITDSSNLTEGVYSEVVHSVPLPLRQNFDYEVLKHHNFMAIQSVLFERRQFEERGGFAADMDALEDWVLWKKYAFGNRFHYVPKVTSIYRTPASPSLIAKRQEAFDAAYPLALVK